MKLTHSILNHDECVGLIYDYGEHRVIVFTTNFIDITWKLEIHNIISDASDGSLNELVFNAILELIKT